MLNSWGQLGVAWHLQCALADSLSGVEKQIYDDADSDDFTSLFSLLSAHHS